MKMMTPMKKNPKMGADMGQDISPMPEYKGKTESTVNDAFAGGGKIVLNVSDYPQLTGIEPGAQIDGKWMGNADSAPDEDGNVSVTFVEMEIETENSADKALNEMKTPADDGGSVDDEDEI